MEQGSRQRPAVAVLEHLALDVRYAIRTLARAPAFACAAVMTLALGIGANTAMFSAVYGILVRPLPYRDAGRLVLVQREQDLQGAHRPVGVPFFSPEDARTWIAGADAFESAALYSSEVAALSGDEGTELLPSAVVSDSFFAVMAGPIQAGRALGAADDRQPSAVISDRLWGRLFARSPDAIGRRIILSSHAYTIVGIADAEFQVPDPRTDVWIPAGFARMTNPRCCGFRLIARVKPDRARAAAASQVAALAASSTAGAPRPDAVRATVIGLRDRIAAPVRPALLVLMAAVGLTLLVACANVTNLLLARQSSRSREIATRRALGASRGRLVLHSLAETAILVIAGAAAGVVLAIVLVTLVQDAEPAMIPRLGDVRLDLPVLLFSAGLAVIAAIVTGIVPALHASGAHAALRPGMTAGAPGARQLRQVLCIAQVAASLILLIGATLLGRSLALLMRSDLGVVTDHVVTASLNFAFGARPPDAQVLARVQAVVERLRAVPGFEAVGIGSALPPNASRLRLTLRGTSDAVAYQAAGVAVTPEYFRALGMRLLKGRLFTAADDLDHSPVMIMSLDTARRFFGDGDPIGRMMTLPVLRNGRTANEQMTLVGVIANVKYSGLDAAADDAVYRPFAQQVVFAPFLAARTSVNPTRAVETLRRAVGEVDRTIVVSDVRPLDAIVSDAAAQPRARSVALASIAGLALVMSIVGLYGVVAYSVSQRSREIGIRMALGAREADVRTMVLREGAAMAAIGIAAGAAAALLLARTLTALLYGVAPTDPASFGFVSAGLLVIMLGAAYGPARRAARVDPNVALRCE